MSCIFVGSTVSFDVYDVRSNRNAKLIEEDVSRTVVGRSGYPAVRFEGRFYELFRLAGSHFIDLNRPHGLS